MNDESENANAILALNIFKYFYLDFSPIALECIVPKIELDYPLYSLGSTPNCFLKLAAKCEELLKPVSSPM